MSNTPLNPDALEASAAAARIDWSGHTDWNGAPNSVQIEYRNLARAAVSAYLAVAQPVVNRVESLPAKMRMLAWEGGEFEIGEIPEGHVLVGFEMATDRAWSMADKVTIHIERKDTTNGR